VSIEHAPNETAECTQAESLGEALNRINNAIHSTLDFDGIIHVAMEEATKVIGAESAAIVIRESGHWVPRYVYGRTTDIIGKAYTNAEAVLASRTAETKQPIVIRDTLAGGHYISEIARSLQIRSLLLVPMIHRDKVIGILSFHCHSVHVDFSSTTIDFAMKLASSVALALENARLFEDQQQDRQRVLAKESISEAGISTADMQELLDTLAVRIGEGMGAHSSTIFLLDETTGEFVAKAACNIPEIVGFHVSGREDFVGKVATVRRTVYIANAATDPLVVNPHIKRAGIGSLLAAPLTARGRLVGVVALGETEIRKYRPEEISLFELMATRTALIIDNMTLVTKLRDALGREREFSLMLQRALLPERPSLGPGYSVADRYIPAYASREIGGDFYDVFCPESGKAVIMIGDVSGKGLESASLAAATRSTARAFAYEVPTAGEILTHTNMAIYGQMREQPVPLFVTMFLAVLDLDTGRFQYAGAGHPPPAVHRTSTGEVEVLGYGDPPVGAFDDHAYHERQDVLCPGDRIILYTDGLTEARHDSEMFGEEGIERILKQAGRLSPDEVADALLSAASDWAEGRLRDDTAVIVIERTY
jgi:phosphoserine phosphatase RsbU/P